MTDTAAPGKKPALGIRSIIGEMFSIFFRNFVLVFVLAFVPCLLSYWLKAPLIGLDAALGMEGIDSSEPWIFILSVVVEVIVYTIASALVIQLVRDLKLNRPVWIVRYCVVTFGALLPLVVLSVFEFVLFYIGMALLIVPGVWVASVFYVLTPAIVIERARFGALRRSIRLTKDYRWSIALVYLMILASALLLGFYKGDLFLVISESIGLVRATIVAAAIDAVLLGLGAISVALVYERLIEIKEGMTTDRFAAVFE